METVSIKKKDAVKAYNNADASGKKLLMDLIGEDQLPLNIMDRIKTVEDACFELGVNEADIDLNISTETFGDRTEALRAIAKLMVVAKALNEGWVPDWNNPNQYKWFPWFESNGSGFRFDVSYYDYAGTDSSGGSRLCFKDKKLAEYAGKQFIDLYNQSLK